MAHGDDMVEGRRNKKGTNKRRQKTTSRSRTQVSLAGLQVKNGGWPGCLRPALAILTVGG